MIDGPVRILAVCTGNISRSPAVERLLRASLDETAQIDSAGVAAVVGSAIDPPVAVFLMEHAAGQAGFAARQVEEAMVTTADLVLTMTTNPSCAGAGIGTFRGTSNLHPVGVCPRPAVDRPQWASRRSQRRGPAARDPATGNGRSCAGATGAGR